MPPCVTQCVCVHSHTNIGWNEAGKPKSRNYFAVSACAKEIAIQLLRAVRELCTFGPNRSDKTNYLGSQRNEPQSFSPLLTANLHVREVVRSFQM